MLAPSWQAATADFPHWHTENRPTVAEVQGWIEAGELYLALDHTGERIVGVVALNHDAPDAYLHASWAIEVPAGQMLVVHALGVSPDFLRQGVARFLVDASLDVVRAKGCRVVGLIPTSRTPWLASCTPAAGLLI